MNYYFDIDNSSSIHMDNIIALFIKRNESKINPMIFNSSIIEKLKLYRIYHDKTCLFNFSYK